MKRHFHLILKIELLLYIDTLECIWKYDDKCHFITNLFQVFLLSQDMHFITLKCRKVYIVTSLFLFLLMLVSKLLMPTGPIQLSKVGKFQDL